MRKVPCLCVVAGLFIIVLLHISKTLVERSSHNQLSVKLNIKSLFYSRSALKEDIKTEYQEQCDAYYESIGLNVSNNPSHSEEHMENRAPMPADHSLKPLTQRDIESVKQFVFFIGYARSGHSIVGSLLDAHPNMVIAHEANLFKIWNGTEREKLLNRTYLYNKLWTNSYNNAVKGWRSKRRGGKGYDLDIDSHWQGNFKKLSVIGDKSGGVTTQTYYNSPEKFNEILKEIEGTVRVPVKVIHVVRNPYDIISTRLLYAAVHDLETQSKGKLNASEDYKYCNILRLRGQVNRTASLAKKVHNFLASTSLDAIDVHLVDLIDGPDQTMKSLCTFLGVDCPQDYVDTCSRKLYKTVPTTRQTVVWPDWLVDKVYLDIIQPFSSFRRYSF